jgi:hypothetical protein
LAGYDEVLSGIVELLEAVRRTSVRAVNAVMTATDWEIGRRIVEGEQCGKARAEYGEALLVRLSVALTGRYGRGFSRAGLQKMRAFYLGWEICSTPSSEFGVLPEAEILQTVSAKSFTGVIRGQRSQ